MSNGSQGMFTHRLDDDVNVVRHHDKMPQRITLAVKMSQCCLNGLACLGTSKKAFTLARIQPGVKLFCEPLVVFFPLGIVMWLRIGLNPRFKFGFPLSQFFLGNGIRQPERDKVSGTRLSPMWQVTPISGDR